MDEKLARLRRLKETLAGVGKTSRGGIEHWLEQARPVIESDWPDNLRGFNMAAATPPELDGTEAADGSEEFQKQKRRIRLWSQDLYSFVSRLLKDAEQAARPEPPTVKRDRTRRNQTLKSPLGLMSIVFSVVTFTVLVVAVAMTFSKGGPANKSPEVTFTVQPAGPYGAKAPVAVKPYGYKARPK